MSNDVNERTLDEAFGKYPSYCKCKVVRDRLSLKVGDSTSLIEARRSMIAAAKKD